MLPYCEGRERGILKFGLVSHYCSGLSFIFLKDGCFVSWFRFYSLSYFSSELSSPLSSLFSLCVFQKRKKMGLSWLGTNKEYTLALLLEYRECQGLNFPFSLSLILYCQEVTSKIGVPFSCSETLDPQKTFL